jgi:hypothetical protein
MDKSKFNIWLAVDEDGESAVSMEGASDARETLEDESGGAAIRTVKLAVTMPLAEGTEVEVEVSDDAGETQDAEETQQVEEAATAE